MSSAVHKAKKKEYKGPQKETVMSDKRGAGRARVKTLLWGKMLEIGEDARDQREMQAREPPCILINDTQGW